MRSYQSRLHDRSRAQRVADGMAKIIETTVEVGALLALFGAMLVLLMLPLQPCETEDSINCSWSAAKQGNGEGASFVNILGVQFGGGE